tara:strand:- start:61 stop:396 length:336 start_codon:yes stop_codon:yes gene_type:complete
MNDFVFTERLIIDQENKINLFHHTEYNFLKMLENISKKVDAVIKRLQIFIKFSKRNKKYLILGKAINEEYQEVKREWNMYIDKIYIILKNISQGNILLEEEAKKLYKNLSL